MRRHDRFAKRRKLEAGRPIGMEPKRGAVEHQFILATDLVDVDQRQSRFDHPAHSDVEPIFGLAAPIGRPVRHQQDFAAGLGKALDDLRPPDVLADRNADANALDDDRPGQCAWHEHALFVEYTVVGQVDLVCEQRIGVIELAVFEPRRADEHGGSAVRRLARERLDCGTAGRLERRLEHQILRRVAGDEEFGKRDNVGAVIRRLCARTTGAFQVAGDIADNRIELRDGNGEAIGRARIHAAGLAPECRRRQWPLRSVQTDGIWSELETGLDEDPVDIGLPVDRVRRPAATDECVLEMGVTLGLHMPVAPANADACVLRDLIGQQRLKLIAPAVAVLGNGADEITRVGADTQPMRIVAAEAHVGQPGTFRAEFEMIAEQHGAVEAETHRVPLVVLGYDQD
jgi:hypothetical protein